MIQHSVEGSFADIWTRKSHGQTSLAMWDVKSFYAVENVHWHQGSGSTVSSSDQETGQEAQDVPGVINAMHVWFTYSEVNSV